VLVVGAGGGARRPSTPPGARHPGDRGTATGGQAGTRTGTLTNLVPGGVSGTELTQRAGVQAIKFGVRLTAPARAVGLRSSPGQHEIELSTGEVATGRAVVIATGAQYRRLDVPRLEEFEMGGVYYAATQAEAQLCGGDSVVIVGGGNSAGRGAMFLSGTASCRL
jgi:thioredoxin reductase (NADPH)